mgnify:CR=1 FL=1
MHMNKKMAAAWLICFALLLLMPGAVWSVTKDRFQTDATENTVSTEIPKLTKDNYRDYPGLVESAFKRGGSVSESADFLFQPDRFKAVL